MEKDNRTDNKTDNKTFEKREEIDYSKLEKVNVSFRRPAKRYMYIVKSVLKFRDSVDVRARPSAAAQVVRVCEALKRLGYISYNNYYTTSVVENEVLQRFLVVNVQKTKDFDKLYEQREEERKKLMETREKENQEKK